jgi:DNA-binding NarL/FixJ family response regulator
MMNSFTNNKKIFVTETLKLTEKEARVMRLVAQGTCNKDIARVEHISVRTVKYYVSTLLTKIGERDRGRLGLLIFAYDIGLVKPKKREGSFNL